MKDGARPTPPVVSGGLQVRPSASRVRSLRSPHAPLTRRPSTCREKTTTGFEEQGSYQ